MKYIYLSKSFFWHFHPENLVKVLLQPRPSKLAIAWGLVPDDLTSERLKVKISCFQSHVCVLGVFVFA